MNGCQICNEAKFMGGSCNVIKSISREIVKKCAKFGIYLDESVAVLAANLLSLDPSNGLNLNKYFERKSIEEFVGKCVEYFVSEQFSTSVKTLMMQAFFMQHSIDINRISKFQEGLLQEKTISLTREITSTSIRTNEDRDRLFKKIVIDIIVQNSLGNPKNVKLVQETASALKSVTSKNDITSLASLTSVERLESLKELREIVCGIHVFNKDSGIWKGEIIDVEKVVLSGYGTTKSQLNISQNEIGHRIDLLMSALIQCININKELEEIQLEVPTKFDSTKYQMLKNILIMHRQHEKYIQSLHESLLIVRKDIDFSLKLYRDLLQEIHEAVKFRTAIPSDRIFPKFSALAKCWRRLQDQVYTLSEINIVNEKLMQLCDEIEQWEDIAFSVAEDNSDLFSSCKISTIRDDIKVIDFTDEIKIENGGFCTWALAKCNGLMIPAKNSIGICIFRNKNYAFCSKEAALDFQSNPEKFEFCIIETSRTNPELIVLLDIFEEAKVYQTEFHRVESLQTVSKNTSEIDVQTEFNFLPSGPCKDYYWNIWDIRRKAIQLANLRRCRTSSSQTNMKYHHLDIDTQTWKPTFSDCQTKLDGSTNVRKPSVFIKYSRGQPCSIDTKSDNQTQHTILTLNIENSP